MRIQVFAAVLAGALTAAASANAADTTLLGRNVASTAVSAEATASEPAAVRVAVRSAVKQLVVTSGPKPDEVLKAIDAVFAACRPANDAPKAVGWSCPSKDVTYSALLEVRGVVLALLDSPEPAAVGAPGSSAFSSFPVTTAGGSYYTELTEKN